MAIVEINLWAFWLGSWVFFLAQSNILPELSRAEAAASPWPGPRQGSSEEFCLLKGLVDAKQERAEFCFTCQRCALSPPFSTLLHTVTLGLCLFVLSAGFLLLEILI